MARKLEVVLVGDSSSLDKAFGRARQSGSRFQAGIGKASKAAAGVLGVLGFAAVKAGRDLVRIEQINAQTAAAIKSTGGAANVSAKGVENLAGRLEALSGVEAETIQQGQNLLLTFTNIRNETGKGNDIFNQATRAMTDMSVALGTDASTSAIQLGKALNDPIKGVTALQRVGVSFTASQKAQIKTLVESGKTMDAQKLILAELSKEFGGSAEAAGKTMGGQLKILGHEVGALMEELVAGLMPAVKSLTGFLRGGAAAMSEHKTATKVAIIAVAALATALIVTNVALKAYRVAVVAATAAQWALNVAMRANPVALVVTALIALGVALVVAWRRSETFRTVVTTAFNVVKSAVLANISAILWAISGFLGGLARVFEAASRIPGVGGKFKGVAESIRGAQDRVDGLRQSINNLKSKDITITVHERRFRSITDVESMRGRRAHGGPVSPGSAYLVGERGPELFVPNRGGQIVPEAIAPSGGRRGAASRPIILQVNLDGRAFARAVFDPLREENSRQVRIGRGLT